ncbi:MAG: M67 family metallopeptidase [Candidatus Bathyarchaeia archaeon]
MLIEEARKMFPVEICGALFGCFSDGEAIIRKIVHLRNTLNSCVAFQIDPEEFLVELIRAENEGLRHIGFFHSHPSSTEPSKMDIKFMRLWPKSIWLIISLVSYEIAAYTIVNGKVCDVYIKIV